MDAKSRLMACGMYVLVISLGIGIAVVSLSLFPDLGTGLRREADDSSAASRRRVEQGLAMRDARLAKQDKPLSADDPQLEQLRSQLEKERRAHDKTKDELKQQTRAFERLQNDHEQFLDLSDEWNGVGNVLPPLPARDDDDQDVDQAEKVPGAATALETLLGEELQAATVESDEARERLESLQREAELEIADLLADHRAFRSALTDFLGRNPESSLPLLVGLLEHRNAAVRSWSADSLGRMGAAASDALPVLHEMQSDDDARVRQAARQAIRLINQ